MLVVSTENIPNQEYEVLGEVFGLTTRSKDMFKDVGASFKSIIRGDQNVYFHA